MKVKFYSTYAKAAAVHYRLIALYGIGASTLISGERVELRVFVKPGDAKKIGVC